MSTTATAEVSITNAPSPTIGEELFLIHLRRESAGSTAEIHKHQTVVGQELWNVHCQRSRGESMEEDKDVEEKTPTIKVGKTGNKGKTKKSTTTPVVSVKKPSKPATAGVSRYNLRSKDVTVTKKKE
jgi:hypothetical protein